MNVGVCPQGLGIALKAGVAGVERGVCLNACLRNQKQIGRNIQTLDVIYRPAAITVNRLRDSTQGIAKKRGQLCLDATDSHVLCVRLVPPLASACLRAPSCSQHRFLLVGRRDACTTGGKR